MKLFRQEAIRKKASKQKSLQKESKFSKSLSNFEKESFPFGLKKKRFPVKKLIIHYNVLKSKLTKIDEVNNFRDIKVS